MEQRKTVRYADVLKENFYCRCGAWIYCPEMNGSKTDDQQNEVPCIGTGCTEQDQDGEFFTCPECKTTYYLE